MLRSSAAMLLVPFGLVHKAQLKRAIKAPRKIAGRTYRQSLLSSIRLYLQASCYITRLLSPARRNLREANAQSIDITKNVVLKSCALVVCTTWLITTLLWGTALW